MPLGERRQPRRDRGTVGLLASQIGYQLRLLRRTPMAAFVTLVVPVMVLLAMGLLYHGVHLASRGGIGYTQFVTPAMLAFAVLTACYMSVITTTVVAREGGVLKRIRSTPLPPAVYMAGRVASAAVSAAIGVALVAAVGVLVYNFRIVWAGVPAALLTLGVGIVCFCALGMAVSALVSSVDSALPVAWGSILPLCFISDVFAPIDGAPAVLRQVASYFPVRPFANSLETAFNPVAGSAAVQWAHLGLIGAWGVAATVVALLAFRWQPAAGRRGGGLARAGLGGASLRELLRGRGGGR